MTKFSSGLHPVTRQKATAKRSGLFSIFNKDTRLIDDVVYVLGFLVPILTIPQAATIWINKTAEGVSLITWTVYLINTIIWTTYGVIHKEKPVIFAFAAMTVLNAVIVVGAILYK